MCVPGVGVFVGVGGIVSDSEACATLRIEEAIGVKFEKSCQLINSSSLREVAVWNTPGQLLLMMGPCH